MSGSNAHTNALKLVKLPVVDQPARWYEASYLALPEHETATCPECGWAGVVIRGDICRCVKCSYSWRWPFGMGMD